MSVLARLAGMASQYLRSRGASGQRRSVTPPGWIPAPPPRRSPPGGRRSVSGPPPRRAGGGSVQPPITGRPAGFADDEDDEFDEVQLLGRDASYDEEDLRQLNTKMRRVSSSNVYSYAYQAESARMGILYVTFLDYTPKAAGGDGEKRNAPGPTYAYYNFPLMKFKQFERMADTSAGGAVWDYCRVRHSAYEHQHTYRLIQVSGDYVPRKATRRGFASRTLLSPGSQGLSLARSTLAPQKFSEQFKRRRQLPTRRAFPNRGQPNRGVPNRGR